MIIQVNGLKFKTYLQMPHLILQAVKRCPICSVRLARNGFYSRWMRSPRRVYRSVIFPEVLPEL